MPRASWAAQHTAVCHDPEYSVPSWLLEILPSEIECKTDYSNSSQYFSGYMCISLITGKFKNQIFLNLRANTAVASYITVFVIHWMQYIYDRWTKTFWDFRNFISVALFTEYLSNHCFRGTVLLKCFDNVAGKMPFCRWTWLSLLGQKNFHYELLHVQ